MKLDLPSLLTIFLHLDEETIFKFIQINKKCFDVSQSCLINPCPLSKRLIQLLENLQTLHVDIDTLCENDKANILDAEFLESYQHCWRLTIPPKKDYNLKIFQPIEYKRLRIINGVDSIFHEELKQHFDEMDELREIHMDIMFLPSLKEKIQNSFIRKLVLTFSMKYEVDLSFLIKHQTCDEVIIRSPFINEIIHLKQRYPMFTYVFISDLLPMTQQLADVLIKEKIFLSNGYIRMNETDINNEKIQKLHQLYLPSYTIHNCNENTLLPQTHKIEIDDEIPQSLFSLTQLTECTIFDKSKKLYPIYDFSVMKSLKTLKLIAFYQLERTVKLPLSIQIFHSRDFVKSTKDIKVSQNINFEDLSLDELRLTGCEIIKLNSQYRHLLLLNCKCNSKLSLINVDSFDIVKCKIKHLIQSRSCHNYRIIDSNIQRNEMK